MGGLQSKYHPLDAITRSAKGESMTDKELLELAAKAAGIELIYIQDGPCRRVQNVGASPWNPLTSDADAFRLAVKLQLETYHGNDEGEAVYAGYYPIESTGMDYCIEYYDDVNHLGDSLSATRRAIVRAAAEIGKTL
jgi:hypothetical protein